MIVVSPPASTSAAIARGLKPRRYQYRPRGRHVHRPGDEVRHDVGRDRGGHEGQGAEEHRGGVVDAGDQLDRVGDELAEHGQAAGGRDHRGDGEQHEVHRQTEEVAAAHGGG
ncbi:hypothetical protein JSY13_04275 [Microbacterium neungamense]|nr:hypothetical protein [Microbacterium neungamense]UWF78777.1 hypothetical protein JSY13_04275 [Microbacterium neungamense]